MTEKTNRMNPLAATLGAAFVASSLSATVAHGAPAEGNPFSARDLGSGYMQLAEGACGEGTCGEGTCGEGDKDKDGEGSCGEGTCGEGSCGGDGDKDGEGACGEGTCGG